MNNSPHNAEAMPTKQSRRFGSGLLSAVGTIASYSTGAFGLAIMTIFTVVAIVGPYVAPYGPFEVSYSGNGSVIRLSEPTWQNPFGTTNQGMDVFSQTIWGTRVALIVGLLSAFGSVLVGTLVGMVSGYFGRWIDETLMRITDVAFGIPFLPFAMVIVTVVKPSLTVIILLTIFFLWRTTARVIRAQVLSLKTRPFIWAARAAGAGHLHVIVKHILPNVLPLSFLYIAIGVQTGVMTEAALSFLGFGDPNTMSWGILLNGAFQAGAMRNAWWWVLPPSLALSLFVIAVFMISRAYEERLNPRLRTV